MSLLDCLRFIPPFLLREISIVDKFCLFMTSFYDNTFRKERLNFKFNQVSIFPNKLLRFGFMLHSRSINNIKIIGSLPSFLHCFLLFFQLASSKSINVIALIWKIPFSTGNLRWINLFDSLLPNYLQRLGGRGRGGHAPVPGPPFS